MSKPDLSQCVLTGCDREAEWMLPWFIKNYYRHNDMPLSVINFGMSPSMLEWLETQVNSIGHLETHTGQPTWFKKPGAMLNSPYKRTVWIDVDCEILGNISGIWKHCMPQKLNMCLDKPWTKRAGEEWYNSGVVAYQGKPDILNNWARKCFENPTQRGDQEELHYMLDPLQKAIYINQLPPQYNYLRLDAVDGNKVKNILIKHHTGAKVKEIIRGLMNE
jgi:hypothetical protein